MLSQEYLFSGYFVNCKTMTEEKEASHSVTAATIRKTKLTVLQKREYKSFFLVANENEH